MTSIFVSCGLCHLILLMFAQFSQCHSALLMNIGLIYVKSMYGMMYLASMDIKMIKTIDGIGSAFVKVCFGKNQWKLDGMFHVWCLISSLAVLVLLCWFSTVNQIMLATLSKNFKSLAHYFLCFLSNAMSCNNCETDVKGFCFVAFFTC